MQHLTKIFQLQSSLKSTQTDDSRYSRLLNLLHHYAVYFYRTIPNAQTYKWIQNHLQKTQVNAIDSEPVGTDLTESRLSKLKKSES